jgi:hypothetical protein
MTTDDQLLLSVGQTPVVQLQSAAAWVTCRQFFDNEV